METSQFAKPEAEELLEEVVGVNRVAKVVKGGRNFRFNAAVVVGDRSGRVGGGVGKAQEISEAIRKAANRAKKSMKSVPMVGSTVPHAVWSRFGGARVMLKPASPGTGIVAGNVVRSVMECAGISDVVTKCLGSTNPINVMRAALQALEQMTGPDYVRALRGVDHVKATHEDVAAEMAAEKERQETAAQAAAEERSTKQEATQEEAHPEQQVEEEAGEESGDTTEAEQEAPADKPSEEVAAGETSETSETSEK